MFGSFVVDKISYNMQSSLAITENQMVENDGAKDPSVMQLTKKVHMSQ
jgi:hypothetical protein